MQLGGQTPLGLAQALKDAGVPVVGTSPESIHLAEERGAFGRVLAEAGLPAPKHGTATTVEEAQAVAEEIGYPVLVRPSYVLGGAGMAIVYDEDTLGAYMAKAASEHPVLIDRFLDDAIEIDVDALFDGEELYLGGVMEHIEEAGDPLRRLGVRPAADHAGRLRHQADPRGHRGHRPRGGRARPAERPVRHGLQRAVRPGGQPEGQPYGAVRVQGDGGAAGQGGGAADAGRDDRRAARRGHAAGFYYDGGTLPLDAPVAVKEAVLPFNRFRGVDTVLGPEMRSTGEVMGIDEFFGTAFAKSQSAAYGALPTKGRAFVSVANKDKRAMIFPVKALADLGFEILATEGTAEVLRRNGVRAKIVRKHSDGTGPDGEPTIVRRILDGEVDLIVNTPFGSPGQGGPRLDGYEIRTAAVSRGIACITTVQGLAAAVQGIQHIVRGDIDVCSLQEHARRLRD